MIASLHQLHLSFLRCLFCLLHVVLNVIQQLALILHQHAHIHKHLMQLDDTLLELLDILIPRLDFVQPELHIAVRLVQFCAVRNMIVIARFQRLPQLFVRRVRTNFTQLSHHFVLHIISMLLLRLFKLLHCAHKRPRHCLMLSNAHLSLRHRIGTLLQKRFILFRDPFESFPNRLRFLIVSFHQRSALLLHVFRLRLRVILAQFIRILLNLLHRRVQRVDLAEKSI
mmetsp:Transcript_4703/g.10056  ORF Transcript_4703/g.10056 Transcript_4703/m.10056 type:complete len:226 (-) Transcript_4703:55-732(-)